DTTFVTVLSGNHLPVKVAGKNDPAHGNGTFLLDWDARAKLAAPGPEVGTAQVTYDHKTEDVKVDVAFHNIKNDQGELASATYHYTQPKGADGRFQFSTNVNLPNTGPEREQLAIESRWKQDGSGRSDVKVSKGELGTNSVTLNECWST